MGLFDKPGADGTLKELHGVAFNLKAAALRPTTTIYGDRDAIDLTVVDVVGRELVYSGFSAGIRAQVQNQEEGDFPCVCTIESVPLGGGKATTQLVPLKEGHGLPLLSGDGLPLVAATDDDIPF